ncbi:MAG: hypothetical protein HY342_09340 [Candidatus Lambdaproteobacteria bacterium]|nr:hypothetical protein [Candidatus Lambdaproteobacteria bacterium]
MPHRIAMLLSCLVVAIGTWPAAACASGATLTGSVELWEPTDGRPVKMASHENAVIFVAGFREAPQPGRHPQLIQKNKSFSQRVLVVTQGETVEFPNHDPIFHNVWSKSGARSFDLGLYRSPEAKPVEFPNLGIVTVFCNIHAEMIASILVLPNNKFAVSDAHGAYHIEGIPPGRHLVYAWVEGAVPVKREVDFADGARVTQQFQLLLQRIPLRHLDKDGKPYKSYSN